jgi:V/A-type H+-transporting ATPase subunit I
MSWREALFPARMERIAVVAPAARLRDILAAMAAAGVVQPVRLPGRTGGDASVALARMSARPEWAAAANAPALTATSPDIAELERDGKLAELAGEAELQTVAASTGRRGRIVAIAGWSPRSAVPALAARLAALGGAVSLRPISAWIQPPTLLPASGRSVAFQPLVDTYGIVPYADSNPSLFAGIAYVLMFGMMFGDAGHGALLLVAGIVIAASRRGWMARFRGMAPFVIGAGITSIAFGFAYGDAFGPTRLVPTLWLAPLHAPLTLMAVAIASGAALLAISYAFGAVNRWREGGIWAALFALPGLAGIALYAGAALAGFGMFLHRSDVATGGFILATTGLLLAFAGLYAKAGGGPQGAVEAVIELFDGVIGIGTNTISFTRLAAFGLTHAALGAIIWSGTTALWGRGPLGYTAAVALFLAGNAITFGLEALVAAIQALRLEYYEMFSRIFVSEGRSFAPWRVPLHAIKESP